MSKRSAAIYIRVSSEAQAEPGKTSPELQEADCRAYCESRGYEVVEVYRDTEKYRSHGRLVEPSGTRSDRPQFLRMLADCDNKKFDTLIAWREDRLYRGVSMAVVGIKDRVKDGRLTVEIVNGSFDVRTAELWAWVAGQENEARVDRHKMGMRGRLQRGLINIPAGVYGYTITNGIASINEEQAVWVREIWKWFGDGASRNEIRKRLIEADAPQLRDGDYRRKRKWSLTVLDVILHRDAYATGLYRATLDGNEHLINIPIIVDDATNQAVQARYRRWKRHPVGNIKADLLLAGKIYCQSCEVRLGVKSHKATLSRKTNASKLYRYYACTHHDKGYNDEGCCGSVRVEVVDKEVWDYLYSLLTIEGRFELAIRERIKELQAAEADAARDTAALSRQLEDLNFERQRYIKSYGKGQIDEDEFETRLLEVDIVKAPVERELRDRRMILNGQADRLIELADAFRLNVVKMLIDLHPNLTPLDPKAAFTLKKRFVDAMVRRVEVCADKSLGIFLQFGLSPAEDYRDDTLLIGLLPYWVDQTDNQTVFTFTITAKVGA
jgi:site-specific DNA recombinase